MYNVNSCMGHFLNDHLQKTGSKRDVHLPSKMVIHMHTHYTLFASVNDQLIVSCNFLIMLLM